MTYPTLVKPSMVTPVPLSSMTKSFSSPCQPMTSSEKVMVIVLEEELVGEGKNDERVTVGEVKSGTTKMVELIISRIVDSTHQW